MLLETMKRENEKIQEENRRLRYEVQGFKEREETFKRAMVNSQKVLDEMKANARKSSEIIIADAEVKAEKILNKAHSRLAQIHEDIAELKRQRIQIEMQIRSVIDAHARLLDIGKESAEAIEQEDVKLKLFKQTR